MNIKRRGFLLGLLGLITGCLPPLKPHRKRAPSCEYIYWYRGYKGDGWSAVAVDYDGQIKPVANLKYIVKPNTQFKGFVYVNRG